MADESQYKILIIDDQPFIIKLIQYNLKRAGYITEALTDGLEALRLIDTIAPDLIILDLRMPTITGTDLCREFRKKDHLKNIPIIVLTAQVPGEAADEVIAAGATDFMTKPFSPVELLANVKKYLEV